MDILEPLYNLYSRSIYERPRGFPRGFIILPVQINLRAYRG